MTLVDYPSVLKKENAMWEEHPGFTESTKALVVKSACAAKRLSSAASTAMMIIRIESHDDSWLLTAFQS